MDLTFQFLHLYHEEKIIIVSRFFFHSTLLQGIVDTKYALRDYEFKWIGSMPDWALFQRIKIQRDCIKDGILPYKLTGNCAYLVWPWIYSPFKVLCYIMCV